MNIMDNPFVFLVLIFIVGLGGLAVHARFFRRPPTATSRPTWFLTPAQLPYKRTQSFLTGAELDFYKYLVGAVAQEWLIFAKVRLADVAITPRGIPDRMRHFNRTSQKHLDFLLCTPDEALPVLAIELDDRSHSHPDRQASDRVKDSVLKAAGVPILRVPVQSSYSARQLAADIRIKIMLPGVSELEASDMAHDATQHLSEANLPDSAIQPTKPGLSRMWLRAGAGILGLLIILLLVHGLTNSESRYGSVVEAASSAQPQQAADAGGTGLVLLPDTSASATAAPVSTGQPPEATIAAEALNLRAGPGTQYDTEGTFQSGMRLQLLGKDATGTWVKVGTPDGQEGWMAVKYLTLNVPLDTIPQVN